MFRLARHAKVLRRTCPQLGFIRNELSTNMIFRRNYQLTIIGTKAMAQSLSLLLKEHPLISRLILYDVQKSTFGLGLDLSHIPSETLVEGRAGHLGTALRGSHIVVLACGEPRNTGQTDNDLFKLNADRITQSVEEICKHCPDAFIVDLTGPINYTIPLISLVLKAGNAYNRGKVIGVTGVDVLRAQACLNLLYDAPKIGPIHVPVICGSSSKTMVPLLSQVTPWFNVDASATIMITEHLRAAEDHVVALKRGSGQSTHLAAYAGLSTITTILNALHGYPEKHIAFVANNGYKTKYFASPVVISKNGISEIAEYQFVASIEAAYLRESIEELTREVTEAEAYYFSKTCNNKLETVREKINEKILKT